MTGIKRLTTADDNNSRYSSATSVVLKIPSKAAAPLLMIDLLNSMEKSIRYRILLEPLDVAVRNFVNSLLISPAVAVLETRVTLTGVRVWRFFVTLLNKALVIVGLSVGNV